jgi:hypothetical protein
MDLNDGNHSLLANPLNFSQSTIPHASRTVPGIESYSSSSGKSMTQSTSSSQTDSFKQVLLKYFKHESWLNDIRDKRCSWKATTQVLLRLLNRERLYYYRAELKDRYDHGHLMIKNYDGWVMVCNEQVSTLQSCSRPMVPDDFNPNTNLILKF